MDLTAGRTKTIMVHALFWGLYVGVEYLANLYHIHPGNASEFFKSLFLTLPFLIAGTYITALWIVPRYIKRGRWLKSVVSIAGVVLLIYFGRIFWLTRIANFDWTVFADPPMGN